MYGLVRWPCVAQQGVGPACTICLACTLIVVVVIGALCGLDRTNHNVLAAGIRHCGGRSHVHNCA